MKSVPDASLDSVPIWQQIRWRILALLFLVTVINFVDRQTLSVVAPVIREQFHLSATDYGKIVSSFMLGMMVGEFPIGWMMDRAGVRTGFSFAVIWWSIATGLHSVARSALQFSGLRFWMGTGECGNFSGGMKVVSEWFPARERALAVGCFNAGSMIGSLIATPVVAFLTIHYGWRVAFVLPGVLGAFWVLAWRSTYRPLNSHPQVTAAEREYISAGSAKLAPPPPNGALLVRIQTWGLMTCRFLVGPVIQFYWFWMADYLHNARGLSLASIGMFGWLPYLFGDLGSIGGGWIAGVLMKHGVSLKNARLITLAAGATCCALSFTVTRATTATLAILLISVVVFGHTFLSANMFAAISDIFPANAVGRVTGLTGIAGGISGILFPLATGFMVDRFSYTPVFLIAAFMPALGVSALSLTAAGFHKVEFPSNEKDQDPQ
jgi:ACS family hexuronate transporter-like MFS transporter